MADPTPPRFDNVSVACKANVFFDGKVISHSIFLADGKRKSLGVMLPGTFRFETAVAERMAIAAGVCQVRMQGQEQWRRYGAGESFDCPAGSWFEVSVDEGLVEYICSFA